ncbi:MAG: LLM class flavin-dependent oxidoreductase, partial [Planctomycetales bacterium]|nr:LLM class flavin-dependent oxidoreductase [Planctomycetales bacterium]
EFPGPNGESVPRVTQPRPIQAELPVWITTAGNPETYRQAGACGANLLTHLLGQSVDEVAEKIRIYRAAREAAGYDPRTGKVTLMLHTLVGDCDESVREIVRGPMKDYLGSSVSLVKQFSWAFPAFKRPKGEGQPADVDLESLTAEELDGILEFAFQRYFETSGLFGSVETCLKMVDRLKGIGVDDIACLIDFGVPTATVTRHLPKLAELRRASNPTGAQTPVASNATEDETVPALVRRHQVTHMQCTPSMARMLLSDESGAHTFRQLDYLLVGGEAFPPAVAQQLQPLVKCSVINMYGPTEATVWASTYAIAAGETQIPIGRPIPFARMYVLNEQMQPVPPGVPGELFIGGELVVRGYHGKPDMTAERFLPDPFVENPTARMYRTGDQARWRTDGQLEFLGRNDHQVKIRGYRIELGEIEARLAQHARIEQVVVVAREDIPGDQRLVAYAVAGGSEPPVSELRDHLRRDLPEYMVPAHFVFLDALPLTPNGKIDRNRLPALDAAPLRSATPYIPPADDLEAKIAELWCKSLGLDKVGVDDNFFDVGGHSLLVVRVHRELTHQIQQPVALTDLYRFPTIRSLVEHLRTTTDTDTLQNSDDRASQRREAMARRRQRTRLE